MRSPSPPVGVLAALGLLLALTACSDGSSSSETEGEDAAPAESAETDLAVAPAGFDLHVGDDQRLLAGVMTADRGLIAFGEVEIAVGPLDEEAPEQAAVTQETTARFLPVPGDEPEGESAQPTVLVGNDTGTGVYETRVDLDQPGPWAMQVTAELADGTTRQGTATFQVGQQPEVPAVGDEAPRSDNLTLDDVDGDEVQPIMVDSRAQEEDAEIPDPVLHEHTIAESIEQGRPVVALFATPVYCQSRFCGPITDTVEELAERYGDRADFVHVEVWRDFDEQELNPAAAEWIQTEQGGSEPWTFLIDEEGRVAARWDNVLDAPALVDALEQLPAVVDNEDESAD